MFLISVDSDMTDRIGMRSAMSSALSWPIPLTSDPLASVSWRDRCGVIHASENEEDIENPDTNM